MELLSCKGVLLNSRVVNCSNHYVFSIVQAVMCSSSLPAWWISVLVPSHTWHLNLLLLFGIHWRKRWDDTEFESIDALPQKYHDTTTY